MTNQEFDTLDELYFTISYKNLRSKLSMEDEQLKEELRSLMGKGWVKCLHNQTDEEIYELENFEEEFKNYNYLATKAGLLAHNRR
jgi:DNA-binding MarR family transcriptional regulator